MVPLTGAARPGLSATIEISDLGTEDESEKNKIILSTNSPPGMIMQAKEKFGACSVYVR